ncbi:DeoR/GlpR family DNA-binding transcription regulator [Mycetocola reblochoni]|uniref:Lactose phosphotransferase system repressor n=2 Tax=Mycetocola reblochoni TaxID=331618 RepID=A0A1R4IV87_9MICO|nr:DeoR/GlpR family DNA-binding transcription regulator [Mycetocola reblochoni]RLP71274.1 DeoR/GlpR transcriptional regulator [Mycetocola reblochoni]SJN23495.1 Transcriptional repressor of the fructose operon, DeoR family [Mycetocola reblochoni REB411]
MFARERQQRIAELLTERSSVTVTELVDELDVTGETIRRDLAALERGGRLDRVHGGAVLRHSSTAEQPLDQRGGSNQTAKLAIADAAAALIPTDFTGSILIDAGSSTAALARLIGERWGHTGSAPTIITHAAPIAAQLSSLIPVHLIGGRVRGLTGAAVGSDTVAAVRTLRPDLAFVGVNGLSATFGLSTPDPEEAAVKSAIVDAARETVVLADASKFDEESLISFAPLSAVGTVVSDRAPSGALADALAAAGVEGVTA